MKNAPCRRWRRGVPRSDDESNLAGRWFLLSIVTAQRKAPNISTVLP
jgi:hypothetical protein